MATSAPRIARSIETRPAAPFRPDRPLPALLKRLLAPAQPYLADALQSWSPGRSDGALLRILERSGALVRYPATTLDSLPGTIDRALCLATGRHPVLLERRGEGWTLSLDGGPGERVADQALLALFPCVVWFAAEIPRKRRDRTGAGGPWLTVTLKVGAQLLGLALPVAMLLIIDRVVTQGAANTLTALLFGLVLLTVFQYQFLWLATLLAVRRGELLDHPARGAVFASVLGCREGGRWSSHAWDVLQACAEGARFGAETRPQFLADCLFVLLLAALMAAFSLQLLAVALAFVPGYVLVQAWGLRRVRGSGETMTALRGDLARRFLESAGAVGTVRSLGLAGHVRGRWEAIDADLAEARGHAHLKRRQTGLAVEFLQKLSVIAIMLLGVGSVIDGTLTLGQYIAFNLLSMQLAQPVLRLAGFRRALQEHRVTRAARRHLEQGCRNAPWPAGGTLALPARERVSLAADRLVVGRNDSALTSPISFGLLGGGWLGVCGPSGSGKSTLLRTLAGMETPQGGTLRLNGVDLTRLRRADLTARVRLVPQEPVIFSASLAENIRFGDPGAPPARIAAVAMVCGLDSLVDVLPEHLGTQVGAGGRPLSGGERQRVALARALLSEPDLLLLDEATAALDSAAEARLLDAIRRFLPTAGVVLVAHRPRSLIGCREIVSLGRDR